LIIVSFIQSLFRSSQMPIFKVTV